MTGNPIQFRLSLLHYYLDYKTNFIFFFMKCLLLAFTSLYIAAIKQAWRWFFFKFFQQQPAVKFQWIAVSAHFILTQGTWAWSLILFLHKYWPSFNFINTNTCCYQWLQVYFLSNKSKRYYVMLSRKVSDVDIMWVIH